MIASNISTEQFISMSGNGLQVGFLTCMGLSFMFTFLLMAGMGLAGPVVSARVIRLDSAVFKINPRLTVSITLIILTITAPYAKFW